MRAGKVLFFFMNGRVGNLNHLLITLGIVESNDEGQLSLRVYIVEREVNILTTQGQIMNHRNVYKPRKNVWC